MSNLLCHQEPRPQAILFEKKNIPEYVINCVFIPFLLKREVCTPPKSKASFPYSVIMEITHPTDASSYSSYLLSLAFTTLNTAAPGSSTRFFPRKR